ncbi:MAG: Na-translocating system protein MpsC family protein, partial [bacterium]
MINKTKGQLEAEISAAITQFEKDHLGRGPKE